MCTGCPMVRGLPGSVGCRPGVTLWDPGAATTDLGRQTSDLGPVLPRRCHGGGPRGSRPVAHGDRAPDDPTVWSRASPPDDGSEMGAGGWGGGLGSRESRPGGCPPRQTSPMGGDEGAVCRSMRTVCHMVRRSHDPVGRHADNNMWTREVVLRPCKPNHQPQRSQLEQRSSADNRQAFRTPLPAPTGRQPYHARPSSRRSKVLPQERAW